MEKIWKCSFCPEHSSCCSPAVAPPLWRRRIFNGDDPVQNKITLFSSLDINLFSSEALLLFLQTFSFILIANSNLHLDNALRKDFMMLYNYSKMLHLENIKQALYVVFNKLSFGSNNLESPVCPKTVWCRLKLDTEMIIKGGASHWD